MNYFHFLRRSFNINATWLEQYEKFEIVKELHNLGLLSFNIDLETIHTHGIDLSRRSEHINEIPLWK